MTPPGLGHRSRPSWREHRRRRRERIRVGQPRAFVSDPDTTLADQRHDCPARWHDDGEFWAVCRHRDIQTVGKDPDTFCSGSGVLMADRGWEIAAQDSILYLDPPSHGPYRKLVSRAFTPRRVAHLEPRIRQLAVELLDAIDPDRPVDLVDTLTAPLPLRPPGSTRGEGRQARRHDGRGATGVHSTVAQVASAFGISTNAVYHWIDRHKLSLGEDLVVACPSPSVRTWRRPAAPGSRRQSTSSPLYNPKVDIPERKGSMKPSSLGHLYRLTGGYGIGGKA